MTAKVLIVDDDLALLDALEDWLTHERYDVRTCSDGSQGLTLVAQWNPDVIVLDWDMPELSGIAMLTQLRADGRRTPVLMLTGKTHIDNKTEGYQTGTDDYLTKPFEPREVSLRLRALLKAEVAARKSKTLQYRDLIVDYESRHVTKDGLPLELSRKEFDLLAFLLKHSGQCFSTEALMERVWKQDADMNSQAIRTCVARLRSKLGDENGEDYIVNRRGEGYCISND